MFKKSLLILLLCGLLTLAWIVGYVLLRVRGPVDELRDAQAKLALGQYAQVVAALNQAEHSASIQRRVSLRIELWRIRAAAYAGLDNPAGALRDVRQLLANGLADDIDLRLDEIRYLARDGQGEAARTRAKIFLSDYPDHARGLELAGEACQTAYQPLLRALLDSLDRELSKFSRDDARQTLLTYLFRPTVDPMVKQAGANLEEYFQTDPRLQQVWLQFWADARALRERIQEGLGFFQRSLDLGGETVAAFRAITTALEQSGRTDDVLMACEIQRRMFDHVYVVESGALAAWIRLQHRLPKAAIATTERWLPSDELPAYIEAGKVTATTEQLLVARALGAWQLRNKQEIALTQKVIRELRDLGFLPLLPLHVSLATRKLHSGSKDLEQIESSLERIVKSATSDVAPLNRPDLISEFARIWIDTLEQNNAPEESITKALKLWRTTRPNEIEPPLRLAKYLLAKNRTPAAMTAIERAAELEPDNPEVFPLQLRIARAHYENSAQDGASLLSQCVRDKVTLPEVRNPIGFILCAEAALSLKDPRLARIALACARNAINAFPSANIPRQIELQALIMDDQIAEAARTATRTVQTIRPNATTLMMAITARNLAGESSRDLIRLALPNIEHRNTDSGRLLQAELLRLALTDAPSTAEQFISPGLVAADATVEQRMLAVEAYVASDNLSKAQALLAETTATDDPAQQELISVALSALILAKANTVEDKKLVRFARNQRNRLQLNSCSQLAMLATAKQLADTHPMTALDVLSHALQTAPPEERNGELYTLAGDLALQQKDSVAAEGYWLAALAFTDGSEIAERLARLLLVQGRTQEAAKVYALTEAPTDPALAARFGLAEIAATLLGDILQQEPTELLTHAALSIFSTAPMLDWTADVDAQTRLQRLDLIAGLRDPLLGWLCVPLAEAVLRADPKSKTSALLLARAAADAGDPKTAGTLHAGVFKDKHKNPVIWREVAYAGQHPDYVTSPELTQRLMQVALQEEPGNSPLTVAYSALQIVKGFEAGGHQDMANSTRLMQWLTMPGLRPCTADDLKLITTGHVPMNACIIIDKILNGPQPCDREAVMAEFYRIANALIAADKEQAKPLVAMAARHLGQEGALGLIVHFILDNFVGEQAINKAQLLTDHLEMVATGRDDQTYLNQTIDTLTELVGIIPCSQAIESTLAKYPTSLPMWAARATLREQLDSEGRGLSDLRSVLTHANAPQAEMRFLELAAAERRLSPQDLEQWQSLPKAQRESPEAAYLGGLIALRQGEAEEAVALLTDAPPQHDGRHLFELALAHLESPDEDGVENATAALTRLLADYPRSSLAQNAGSFLRQLSPRP